MPDTFSTMQPAVQQFILQLPEHKSRITQQVRDIFLTADKNLTEAMKWNQLTFSIGKTNIAFIYSFPNLEYMNLGFFKATSLPDPKKLFEGTGKNMRHIKLYHDKRIPTTQIKAWIKETVLLSSKPVAQAKVKTKS